MQAGRLNKLVSLQIKSTTGVDDWGQPTPETWSEVAQIYVSIDPPSGSTMRGAAETIMAGSPMAYDLAEITAYVRDDVKPLTHRIEYPILSGKFYDIQAVRPTNKRDRMSLVCVVGASNG